MVNWNPITTFNDGKFNWITHSDNAVLPGYVNDTDHPFTYCYSLTHVDPTTGNPDTGFCIGDDPKLFQKNLLKMPSSWKYRTKKVEYKVNASGYRTKEWKDIDWKNSVVIFGCSMTFGTGLNEDETISYHLEKKLGRPVINLGYPSGSNNLILNNSAACIENFEIPWGVVINWSTTDRFRFYEKMGYIDTGPWLNPNNKPVMSENVNVSDLWLNFYYNPANEKTTSFYLSRAAKAMWEGRTKYCTISYFEDSAHVTRSDQVFLINPNDRARDVIHPGEGDSIKVAEYLSKKLNGII